MPPVPRRSIHLPAPGTKRAVVIGAGSFGTAVAVLLARGGLRTTLQTRTEEQAALLSEERENRVYLSGVEFPRELRVEHTGSGLARADYVFLGVPSSRAGRRHRGAGRSRPAAEGGGRLAGQGTGPAERHPPDRVAAAPLRRQSHGVHGRSRPRAGDGQRGRRAGLRLDRGVSRHRTGRRVHPRRRCLRGVQRSRPESSWRAWPRTPRRSPRARPRLRG